MKLSLIRHPTHFGLRNFRNTIDIPGFHATTWYDIFLTSVIAAYTEIEGRAGNQRLWIGPNGHYFIYEEQFWPRDPYFEWFGHWLKDEDSPLLEEPPVHFSTRAWTDDPQGYAANDWKFSNRWPLSRRSKNTSTSRSTAPSWTMWAEGARTYTYDPRRPVATYGGRNMAIDPGPMDQRPAEGHPDYGLVYRCDPLDTEMTIAGPVRVDLHVSSDCPDTDFVASWSRRLRPVKPSFLMDGVTRAMLRSGTDQIERLTPGEIVVSPSPSDRFTTRFRLELPSCRHHQQQFPRRARNTNSGNLTLAKDGDADIRVAYNAVHHGGRVANVVNFRVFCQLAV